MVTCDFGCKSDTRREYEKLLDIQCCPETMLRNGIFRGGISDTHCQGQYLVLRNMA
jgi:hypothetical protein